MKKLSMYQYKRWLVWGVFLTYFGLQISCTPENPMDRKVQVILQIPLPNPEGLKKASAIASVKSVMLKVTSGSEVLVTKELTISGNTANGTISILPGKNRKFTAEAMDENSIIQWQGSRTVDIVDDFKVDLELTPIPPSASNLYATEKGKSVNLSWTKNSDPDFDRYYLYRSPSNSDIGVRLFIGNANIDTAYMDINVSEGTPNFYTLVVLDSEGFKTESKANISPNFNPSASKLQLDTLSFNYNTKYHEAKLSWTQNNNADFASYVLYRSTSNNELGSVIYSTTVGTNSVYIDNSKLSEGDIYFYTLVVSDTSGLNTKSNLVQINIPLIPPSTSVLYGGLDGSVYLYWTQNTDLDFARYDLYRSQSESLLGTNIYSTVFVTNTVYEDSQVSEGMIYFYSLLVTNSKGSNSRSNIVQVDIPLTPPTASILQKDSVMRDMVKLLWTQNFDLDFDRYELYRSPSEKELGSRIFYTNKSDSTEFKDINVSSYTQYFYTLIVFDTKGLSTKSDVVYVLTLD